jgi:hypothetical protein
MFIESSKKTQAVVDKLEMIDVTDLEIYGEVLFEGSQKSHEDHQLNQERPSVMTAKDKSLLFVLTIERALIVSIKTLILMIKM